MISFEDALLWASAQRAGVRGSFRIGAEACRSTDHFHLDISDAVCEGWDVLIDAERDPKRTIFKKSKQSCPNHFQSVRGNQFWIFSASAHASAVGSSSSCSAAFVA